MADEPKNKYLSKVTHQGLWDIGHDITIECYVTSDKRRLLSLRGTARAMDLKGGGSGALLRNLKSKWIQPYLSDHLKSWILEAECETLHKISSVSGPAFIPFDAELFVDVCKAYIQAKNDTCFNNASFIGQSQIADRLLSIMSAFAKVGIIALVDEITGYQKDREKDELQKILSAYIAEEYLEWAKRFPDEFYKQMFRLKRWGDFQRAGQKMPQVVGKYTNEIIYKQLPDGVLEELRNKTPKSESGNNLIKYHQFLTPDTGIIHLDKHLIAVITLMKASTTWEEFIFLFNRSMSKPVQGILDFERGFN